MNKPFVTLKRCSWIVFAILLAGCGTMPTQQPVTPSTTSTPVPATATISPTETLAPTPSSTPLTLFPLDGYVMLFTKDDNLYFQDGNNSPVQLTQNAEKAYHALISDDNTKIVYFRGQSSNDKYTSIFSVNSDGSQEQALITPNWLAKFGSGVVAGSASFVPGTHQLLFNTFRCGDEKRISLCEKGLSLVNTDTGAIKEFIVPGKTSQTNFYNNFIVSPDGKKVVITFAGHIDILRMDAKIIRHGILAYIPSTPIALFPDIYWLSDSSGLIAAIPSSANYGVGYESAPVYTVWRYAIDADSTIQVPLNPFPTLTYAECGAVTYISPDRNWGLYDSKEPALHIWNISNGTTRLYAAGGCSVPSWSPDNKHFIYGGRNRPYFLGSIDKAPVRIEGIFSKWLDAKHFIYTDITNGNSPQDRIGEIGENGILTYDSGQYSLIKPK